MQNVRRDVWGGTLGAWVGWLLAHGLRGGAFELGGRPTLRWCPRPGSLGGFDIAHDFNCGGAGLDQWRVGCGVDGNDLEMLFVECHAEEIARG